MTSVFTKQLHKNLISKMTHATYVIQNWWRKHLLIKGKARMKVIEARMKVIEARNAVLERKLREFEEYGGTLSSDEDGYMNPNSLF